MGSSRGLLLATAMLLCHVRCGAGSLLAPQDKPNHEICFADVNGDGVSDIIQHNMRTGDVLAFKTRHSCDNRLLLSDLRMRYVVKPYARSRYGQAMPEEPKRVLNCLMWYDGAWSEGQNGIAWPPMNPNHPGPVPKTGNYAGSLIHPKDVYRTGTSLLGTYDLRDPAVNRQHAYWLCAMGIDGIVIDWSNVTASKADGSTATTGYSSGQVITTETLLRAYTGITDFRPPRVVIAIRIFGSDYAMATAVADIVHDLYKKYPDQFFRHNDGSADRHKPLLIVFSDFGPEWRKGPRWTDSRFNCRYTNGYFTHSGMTTPESDDWRWVTDDLPYWSFVECVQHPKKGPGYYQNVYRRLYSAGGHVPEHAPVWVSVFSGLPDGSWTWDGQLDLVDGKSCLQRYSETLFSKYPRVVVINRFNCPLGWYDQPQEGVSWNGCAMIEPSVEAGFLIYNRAATLVHKLKRLCMRPPSKPVITHCDGRSITFFSDNYPTQYRISLRADGLGDRWEYIDVRKKSVELPPQCRGRQFYLATANPFGVSETLRCSPPARVRRESPDD